uniref:Uncharacterized protein n=2 Tax=Picea TaxID=3328 RepID=A0A117NGX4_PICGL|nr:hypothetical protein ABT39_MTgene5654 [Picea glauca]QHR90261.1 hypothetical protein Q903MT_gene4284 [Picea sitchensis]
MNEDRIARICLPFMLVPLITTNYLFYLPTDIDCLPHLSYFVMPPKLIALDDRMEGLHIEHCLPASNPSRLLQGFHLVRRRDGRSKKGFPRLR